MENKTYSSIKIMRAFSAMAIVLMHCLPNELRGGLSLSQTLATGTFKSFLEFAIPVFTMITGALLLGRDESVPRLLKRVLRIFLALLIFGTGMSFMELFFVTRAPVSSAFKAILSVFMGTSWDVLWYLYMLIGLYLILPVLRKFVQNSDNATIVFIMVVLFAGNSIIPAVNTLAGSKVIGFYLPFTNACLFYTLFGYYAFCRMEFSIKKPVLWATVAVVMIYNAIMLTVKGSFSLTNGLLEYASPTTALLSMAIFLLLKDCRFSSAFSDSIADNSFGIYLIHCIIIQIINRLLGFYPESYPLYLSIPGFFAVVFVVSWISSAILRKVPFVGKYIL